MRFLLHVCIALHVPCLLLACAPASEAPRAHAGGEPETALELSLAGVVSPAAAPPGWSAATGMGSLRYRHTLTPLPDGRVLATGGHNGTSVVATAELYDPASGTWTPTGSMASARYLHTATLLPDGRVLVTGGHNGASVVATAELYDPASGTWSATGSMASVRYYATTTSLPDGRVLVAGGIGTAALATAELYDPASGTWSATGSMTSARRSHAATLLPDGRVLVVGGHSGTSVVATAELYEPASGTWTPTGSMASARYEHTAPLLPDGRVLVTGGIGTAALATAELYDPASGTWSATGAMASARYYHTVTSLPDGRVLVTGGYTTAGLATAELYDPASGTWSTTGSMASARYYAATTSLSDGRVLVVGGNNGTAALATAELYDPAASTWTSAGSMASEHGFSTATLLPNGQVLVAGGTPHAAAELYDPASGSWKPAGSARSPRSHHTATLLPHGQVLVTGGISNSTLLATSESYDPTTGSWASLAPLRSARGDHTATWLPGGRVLVTGGTDGTGSLTSSELYDPVSGSWNTTGAMTSPRSLHTATLLPGGKVLVAGGVTGFSTLALTERYDPATGSWNASNPMTSPRALHTATLLPNGKVLVTGGHNGTSALATSQLYDPASGTWAATGALSTARFRHTATLLPNGRVLVTGGDSDSGPLDTAELYEPRSGTWKVVASMATPRQAHDAVLLPSGRLLVLGGGSATAELYDDVGTREEWRARPDAPGRLTPGRSFTLTGAGFRGPSASDFPQLSLLSLQGGSLTRFSWSRFSETEVLATLPDVAYGHYVLFVTANGITSGQPVQVVDAAPPETAFLTTPAIATKEQATFSLSSPDTDSTGYECSLDEAGFSPCASTLSFGDLADGPHLFRARAIDASGNADPTPASHAWTLDTQAPEAPRLLTPTEGASVQLPEAVVTGSAEPGSTVTLFLQGQAVATVVADEGGHWSVTLQPELAPGRREVSATATDAVGNTSPSSPPVLITLELRSNYGWGCTSLPASPIPWALLASLGLVLQRRRARSPRPCSRSLPLVLALLCAAPGGEALAGSLDSTSYPQTNNPSIRQAAHLYDELEYEKALQALDAAEAFEGNGPEERLWLDLMRGVIHHGLQNDPEADAALRKALSRNPAAQLPVPLPSQTLQDRFERLRGEVREALAQAVAREAPPAEPPTRLWSLMVGLRAEAEVRHSALVPSVSAELAHAPGTGSGPGWGGALTLVAQPSPAVRAEARLYPYDVQAPGFTWIRPQVLLGATTFLPAGVVAGRLGVGVGLHTGNLRLFTDVAYERVLDPAQGHEPNAVLFSLGVGWSPRSTVR